MKKLLLLILVALFTTTSLIAQVAINATGAAADPSAALDVGSTTKGFLPPRMTREQMNAIVDPVQGLWVYCSDCIPKGHYFYDGTCWTPLSLSLNVDEIYNPIAGEIWMDRNLGVSQVATFCKVLYI